MTDTPNLEPLLLDAERKAQASRTLLAAGQVVESRALAASALDRLRVISERLDVPFEAPSRSPTDDVADTTRLVEAAERLARQLAPRALEPRTLRRRRRRTGLVRALGAIVVTIAVLFAFDLRPGMHAKASSVFDASPFFDGSRAVDGNHATEWQTLDRVDGTLDVHLVPSRTIHTLTLWNGHNRWYVDRAVRSFYVELVRDGAVVKRVEAAFPSLTRDPSSLELDVGREPRIDHVRVVVTSHFGLGSALAELEIR